jgi:hypothetical protein
MQIRRIVVLVTPVTQSSPFRTAVDRDGGARAHAATTPANLDCLVNKLRGEKIRTLFIKLQLILHEMIWLIRSSTA